MEISSTGNGRRKAKAPGSEAILPIRPAATLAMGGRFFGSPIMVNVMPMFEGRKPLAPVSVKSISTWGSLWRAWSTRSWIARICSGEEPSLPRKAPKMTPLSPGGRKTLGIETKSRIVPARQAAQIASEIQRWRRNHQSESA